MVCCMSPHPHLLNHITLHPPTQTRTLQFSGTPFLLCPSPTYSKSCSCRLWNISQVLCVSTAAAGVQVSRISHQASGQDIPSDLQLSSLLWLDLFFCTAFRVIVLKGNSVSVINLYCPLPDKHYRLPHAHRINPNGQLELWGALALSDTPGRQTRLGPGRAVLAWKLLALLCLYFLFSTLVSFARYRMFLSVSCLLTF